MVKGGFLRVRMHIEDHVKFMRILTLNVLSEQDK